ncbi:aldo/keto reductase [Shewanella sp. C32]|uniref:Aldo/keto reductase n=1 Tax=Shewanella electrica TaxID=515560 RepID=A0ABT2FI04_9GAMM|nr:aldo/keto reductase [Shewanella electrica]MCH1923509.1 aldo/keto reductase [Shewanella electrica]MCS4555606.1 aldo/keto reductase [Shewanella electrica]
MPIDILKVTAKEDAQKAGKICAIGLSNFQKQDIDNILASCTVKPVVNQILARATNVPTELIKYSQDKGMLVEAYSPVGHGELFKNDAIKAMAESYDVSIPQLCIRYVLQLGLLPLPKTANPAHMQSNADVDFVISDADMATLKAMERIKDYGDASGFPVYQQD